MVMIYVIIIVLILAYPAVCLPGSDPDLEAAGRLLAPLTLTGGWCPTNGWDGATAHLREAGILEKTARHLSGSVAWATDWSGVPIGWWWAGRGMLTELVCLGATSATVRLLIHQLFFLWVLRKAEHSPLFFCFSFCLGDSLCFLLGKGLYPAFPRIFSTLSTSRLIYELCTYIFYLCFFLCALQCMHRTPNKPSK